MVKQNVEDLIKKFANKSEEEMIKEQDELEAEYIARSIELDQAISEFDVTIDELKDPKTGKTLAEVKRPTASQFRRVIPPELAKFRKNPEKIPYETAMKYEDDMYKLMEELIVRPKHTAKEWRESTGGRFMAFFQSHLVKLNEKVREDTESFLPQT